MKAIRMLAIAATIQTLAAHPKDYIPAAPPYDKPVASYTVADVVGCAFSTPELLANGHPFKAKGAEKTIKNQWPGATTATNIDLILSYIVNAQTPQEERTVGEGLFWCIHEMTDVSKADQAAAFVRTHAAQADPANKRKIALMADRLFPYLARAGVLNPLKDLLDDASAYESFRNEGRSIATTTTRRKSAGILRKLIFSKDLLSIDLPNGEYLMSPADMESIYGESVSEVDTCSRLKVWMNTNWSTIESQCVKIAAATDPPYSLPHKKYLTAPPPKAP